MANDPPQPGTTSIVEGDGRHATKFETDKLNHEALIREMYELRMDVNAIEEEIARLEIALQKWEAAQRWQLDDVLKELRTVSWAANLCALAALFYIISESWRHWG